MTIVEAKSYLTNEYPNYDFKEQEVPCKGMALTMSEKELDANGNRIGLNLYETVLATVGSSEELKQMVESYISQQTMDSVRSFSDAVRNYKDAKELLMLRVRDERINPLPGDVVRMQNDCSGLTGFVAVVSPHGDMSVKVTDSLLTRYGITEDELFEVAMENSRKSVSIKNLGAMLEELKGQEVAPTPLTYVLTNEVGAEGAGLILIPDVLDRISRAFGEIQEEIVKAGGGTIPECFRPNADLVIIPSSVNEVMVMPASGEMGAEEFDAMIQSVNETELSPSEILSDHAFYYDADEKELYVYSEWEAEREYEEKEDIE